MVWPTHNIIWQHIAECPEHIPQLACWFQDEWGLSDRECTLETRYEELKAKTDKNSLPLTMVAISQGELLGTYTLDLTDLDIRPNLSPWLASVFVNPKYRHKGIGTLLVKESLQHAESLGLGILYLYTKSSRASWYASMGWQTIEELFYRDEDLTIMRFIGAI